MLNIFPVSSFAVCKQNIFDETLSYDISFLFFKNAADATLTIRRSKKKEGLWFEATLKAKTRGFVGFLTDYTKYTYHSLMRLNEQNNRLISVKFEKRIVWGAFSTSKNVTKFLFDETKRSITLRYKTDGNPESVENMTIPSEIGQYEDLLSALYNLRSGVYGALVPGRRIILHTVPFPKKYVPNPRSKVDSLTIHIATDKEREEFRAADGHKENGGKGFLVFLDVPAGIFDEKKPVRARIWTNTCFVPVLVFIENMMSFGDVVGRIRQ